MTDHVIVIGAGAIGASIAWHLARRSVRVSILDQGLPASAASDRSFGWLNASFYGDAAQTGCAVEAILDKDRKVQGVRIAAGDQLADRVLVAAGTGPVDLLSSVGVALPFLPRPGVIIETRPVAPVADVVMVSPLMEFRQLPNRRFIAPTAAGHQGDTSDRLHRHPWTAALAAVARLIEKVTLPRIAPGRGERRLEAGPERRLAAARTCAN